MNIEERLMNAGHEGVVYFVDPSYDDAIIGISHDERVIYDFDKMIECLMKEENMDVIEAIEWIEYNAVRSLPYCGDKAPIIMYPIE